MKEIPQGSLHTWHCLTLISFIVSGTLCTLNLIAVDSKERCIHQRGYKEPLQSFMYPLWYKHRLPFNIASRGNRAFWSSDTSANVSGSRVWQTSSVNALRLALGRIYSLILVVPKSTRLLSVYFLLAQTGRFYCTLHKGVQHIRRSVFPCISSQWHNKHGDWWFRVQIPD